MSTKQDLLALAEGVEKGEYDNGYSLGYDLDWDEALHPHLDKVLQEDCLTSAKALHDAVLPGWGVGYIKQRGDVWQVNLVQTNINGEASTPAAAWVAAILRAKAEEKAND